MGKLIVLHLHLLTLPVLRRLVSRCSQQQQQRHVHVSAPRRDSKKQPNLKEALTAKVEIPPQGIPYSELTVGVPRETFPNEARVAVSPSGVAALRKAGFKRVVVESNAGAAANFPNDAYTAAGAEIVSDGSATSTADIVLGVRPPSLDVAATLNKDQTLISFLHPGINKELVEKIRQTGATSFAMDAIPRISRAQVYDALSSMANTAGYRAVLEAGNAFGRFFTGQVTAAGKIPPAKVLVSASRARSPGGCAGRWCSSSREMQAWSLASSIGRRSITSDVFDTLDHIACRGCYSGTGYTRACVPCQGTYGFASLSIPHPCLSRLSCRISHSVFPANTHVDD